MEMKLKTSLTISSELVSKIDRLRGREKRSTFVEHLIKLGLREYVKEQEERHRDEQRIQKNS